MTAYTFKTVVCGDSAIGKTTLIHRYTKDEFITDFLTTIGVGFEVKDGEMEGVPYILQMWEMGGQDRFHFCQPDYYKGAKGGLLVFGLDRAESLDSIEKEWLPSFRRFADPANDNKPVVLVGTKSDLKEYRKVDYKEAKAVADRIGCAYFEISSKTGQNVPEVFDYIARKMLEKEKAII